jgi:hypothetical protein
LPGPAAADVGNPWPAHLAGALALAVAGLTALVAGLQPPAMLAILVGALCLALLCLPPAQPPAEVGPSARPLLLVLAFIALLAAKDLLPTFPVSGEAERRAALATAVLAWPANARNPVLGAAAAQLAGLLLGLALGTTLAGRLAGPGQRTLLALQVPAWALAAFGLAVTLATAAGRPYGPENCIGNLASKNGAAALVAIGLLLHAGLARHALRRNSLVLATAHILATVSLLPPLGRLGSLTALLALGAGIATHLWLETGRNRPARPALALALTLATLAALGVATLDPRLANRLAGLAGDYRWQIWRDTLPLALTYPLGGVGLGAFEPVYPLFGSLELPYDARLVHPDSSWVKLLHEWGLLPLGLALAVGGRAAWRRLGRLRPRGAGLDPGEPGRIAAAGAVAWLASGLTDVTLHRPESWLVGSALLGIAAAASGGTGRGGSPAAPATARRRPGRTALVVGLLLLGAGGLAAWAAGAGRRELRWGLLDPARLWAQAAGATSDGPPSPAQLARFHAAVRLQHRSVSYPNAAARLLHPRAPEAAFAFWQAAVQRAGHNGSDYFARAVADFPATPPGYWARLANATDPDFLLLVPTLSPAERTRAVVAWIARAGPQPTAPDRTRWLLAAIEQLGRPELLADAVARLHVADPAFWIEAARRLQVAGRAEAAWTAVARLLPDDGEKSPSRAPASTLSPDVLLQLRRYPELQEWLLRPASGDSVARRELLGKICAVPASPAWFHFQLARALAAAGDPAAAVDRALTALAARRN